MSADNEIVLSKREFLFGRKALVEQSIPPPWAQNIHQSCTQCGDCLDACSENILTLDAMNFPKVDFSLGECTFCGECADVCNDSVFLDRDGPAVTPWDLAVSVSKQCLLESKVYCRSCGDACPEGAIKFKLELASVTHIKINHELCSGCGACVASCPKDAVSIQNTRQSPDQSSSQSANQNSTQFSLQQKELT